MRDGPGMERFEVLDSWRGIAACLVALFHLEAYSHLVYSHLHGVALLRNAWLFVDFFFVLSGFVIAANYQQRLVQGFGAGRFLLLRLGRLYPLHFAMLALAVGVKLLLLLAPALAPSSPAPFSTPQEAPATIVANLLLVHSLHLFDFLTWNGPSWSISTEFYTYVLFAAACVGLRERAWLALLAALVAGPLLLAGLSEHNMATEHDWGLVRCVYGFAAGALAWGAYRRWRPALEKRLSGSRAEWGAIGLIVVFVSAAGTTRLSLAAPFVFALAVLVFAFAAGSASALLRLRPLVFLGTISYSIYLTHVFVARRLFDAGRVVERLWQVEPFARREIDGQVVEVLGTQTWHGDVAYAVFLAAVVAVSWCTYRMIEKPGRDWARKRVHAWRAAPVPRAAGAA